MNHPESQLQVAVAELLDLYGWRYAHVPNGGKRNPREAARLKREGVKKGVPDFLIFEDWRKVESGRMLGGHGVAIELKAGNGKPTEAQKEWLAELDLRGWLVGVCRSLDEVQAILRLVRPLNGRRMG